MVTVAAALADCHHPFRSLPSVTPTYVKSVFVLSPHSMTVVCRHDDVDATDADNCRPAIYKDFVANRSSEGALTTRSCRQAISLMKSLPYVPIDESMKTQDLRT
jgi:hypothetical protein